MHMSFVHPALMGIALAGAIVTIGVSAVAHGSEWVTESGLERPLERPAIALGATQPPLVRTASARLHRPDLVSIGTDRRVHEGRLLRFAKRLMPWSRNQALKLPKSVEMDPSLVLSVKDVKSEWMRGSSLGSGVPMRRPSFDHRSWECLSQAIYFEARGESTRGRQAVAEVIMNRVRSADYPNSVCAVVEQGSDERFRCQFTYYCDGLPERITEPDVYRDIKAIALTMLTTRQTPLTDGALHFHTVDVRPNWSKRLVQTVTIGQHKFYRLPG